MEAYMNAPRFDATQSGRTLPKASFDASLKAAVSSSEREIGSSECLPWRANTYYGAAAGDRNVPYGRSMPEPQYPGYSLGTLDPVKVPPIFPAARSNLYTRYTPENWETSNASNVAFGEKVRDESIQLRSQALALCRELDEKTKHTQQDVGKDLGERIGNVEHWKGKVKAELDAAIGETEALQECLQVLGKAGADLERPLRVAHECLYSREKRRGIDLVHDDVEKELIMEVDVLKKYQNEIKRLIGQGNAQLSLVRAAQHELEKDLADKAVALNLDGRCHSMKNSSRHAKYHDGIHRIDNTASVPLTWAQFSEANIRRSVAERTASRDFRKAALALVDSAAEETKRQENRVNDALRERLREYQEARNVIQNNLLKILEEISEMEKTIELLRASIADKEAPLQVAQTRLVTRIRRPNVEACQDKPQHRLKEEVYEINESVDQLRSKLRQSEWGLQKLLKSKLSLEHDLDIKNNSIFVDREGCLGIRSRPPTVYVGTLLKSC